MAIPERLSIGAVAPIARLNLSYRLVSMTGDLLLVLDLLGLLMAASMSTWLYARGTGLLGVAPALGVVLTPATWVVVVLAPFALYERQFGALASRGLEARLVRAHALRYTPLAAVVLMLAALAQAPQAFAHGGLLPLWLASGLLLSTLTRVLLARAVLGLQRRGLLSEVIAVVGAGAVADRLVQALGQVRPETIELLGIFDDAAAPAQPGTTAPSGTIARLIGLGQTRRIDWIVLTLPPTDVSQLQSIVQRLKALSVPIGLCPQHVGLTQPCGAAEVVGDSVTVSLLADRPIKSWHAAIKTAEDVLIGGAVTLLLLPVLALVAVAVRLESPGPVIFKQRRYAENNREFDIYKFRTMRWNATDATQDLLQTSRCDGRITRVGRFLRASSLDELPQLFNVLKGDMSLVGPRPHAVNMRTEDRLGHEITELYVHRHRVKPGITGWSQVNGARGATDTTAQLLRRVTLDLHYIENWSLWLDLKILALTAREVIKRTNAY
jgi:Undecaprenyl-phosphate glucose phosphotransferase